jgi:hypothetical protein
MPRHPQRVIRFDYIENAPRRLIVHFDRIGTPKANEVRQS